MSTVKVEIAENGVIECYGVKISTALFEHFSDRANEGTLFKFVKNQDGVITVERIGEASA